jgi:cytochrome b pre-mRNA-processing protein 3
MKRLLLISPELAPRAGGLNMRVHAQGASPPERTERGVIMIRALFARLTGEPKRGQGLFDLAVAEARRPHWFVEGKVADTVEGRFAILATVTALLIVRLEREGTEGEAASVGLTERFVEAMDAEIREMGVGDPALGRQVRSLVGALGTRVERWRAAVDSNAGWTDAVCRSVYRGQEEDPDASGHAADSLKTLWARIEHAPLEELREGRLE